MTPCAMTPCAMTPCAMTPCPHCASTDLECRWYDARTPAQLAMGFDPPCEVDAYLERERLRRRNLQLGLCASLLAPVALACLMWWLS